VGGVHRSSGSVLPDPSIGISHDYGNLLSFPNEEIAMGKGAQKDPSKQGEHRSSSQRIRDLEALNANLQDSEERLRILFEHAPDAYYLLDVKGTFVDGNAAAEAMTGYTRDKLIGKSFLRLKLLSPPDLLRAAALLARSAAGQSTGPDEFVLNRKDGTQVSIEIRTHPIKIGGQLLVLGISRDITARKEAEDRLRLLSLVAEQSPISIGIANSEGIIEFANPKLLSLYGTPLEETIGRRWTDYVSADSSLREQIQELPSEVLENGNVWSADVKDIDADGNAVWRRATVFRVTGEQDETSHTVYMSEDVTARMRSQEALRASEYQYATLVESTTDGIVIVQDGVVCFVNSASLNLLGYSPDELVGTTFIGHVAHEFRDIVIRRYEDRMAGKEPPSIYEIALLRKDSTQLPVEINATQIVYLDEPASLVFLRDITERRATEETLRESEHYLREAQAMAQLGHWKLDPATQEITGSDELFRIFGLGREEATLDAFVQVVHPDDRELDASHIRRGIEYGEDWDIQHRLICRDGAEKTVHAIGHAITDETGKTILLLGIVQDITEQVRAEEQIRVEKEFTDTALDAQMDTFFLFEAATGKAVRWNRAFRDITGYTDKEIARMPAPASYYGPEDLERAGAFLENVMEEATGTIVLELICKDGRAIPTEYSVSVIYDDQGQPRHIISIGRDITRQKEIETALRDSEERFRSIVAQSVDGIALVDTSGKIVLWNKALETITGIPLGEAVGRNLWDIQYKLIPAEDRPSEELQRLKEIAEAMLRGEQPSSLEKYQEYTIERVDGERRDVQLANFLVDIEEQPMLGTIVRDTTEHKQAQDALREREQESQAFVETSRDWIWSINLQGIHTYSNPAIEKILGYTPDELIGGTSLDLLHPDDRRDVEAKLPGWIAERRGWRNLVLRWRHKNGEWRWLESNCVPTFDSTGELSGFRGVDRDITERREAERQLRETLESTIQAVAGTIETRDPYTAGHQQRVTKLAVAIARRLGLPDERVEGIRVAATLHDIGKMSTPAEILSKPGKLSEHEFKLIQDHTRVAHSILEGIAFPWPVADIVLQHHERLDGTGYPAGLVGDDIRLEARIISVADTVEAMSSHRPYRPALGLDMALAEIERNKGIHYDSAVVDACIALFEAGEFSLDE